MKQEITPRKMILGVIFRACAVFFPLLLWIMMVYLIDHFIPENNVRNPVVLARGEKLLLSFLALNSCYRLFSVFDLNYGNRFLERVAPESRRRRVAFVLRAPEFWLAALPPLVLIPALIDRFPLTAFLWSDARIPWAVVFLLTMLYLFAGVFFCHYQAHHFWLAFNEKHPIRAALKQLLIILILYPVGAYILPILGATFISVGKILLISPVILALIAVIAVIWLILALRAVRKRRKFYRALNKLCEQSGYRISGLRGGFRAIFLPFQDAAFTVQVGEKTFNCQMICCLRRSIPLILSPDGNAMFLHSFRIRGIEMFRYATVRRVGNPEDGQKLLIAVPVAGFVYSGSGEVPGYAGTVAPRLSGPGRMGHAILKYTPQQTVHSGIRPIDTGVSVGNFKFFTSTGFLGALERDVLDR